MTIEYSREDQDKYYKERCYYICAMAGIEPILITAENIQEIERHLYLNVTEPNSTRLQHEISNILLFSETIGFIEGDSNA